MAGRYVRSAQRVACHQSQFESALLFHERKAALRHVRYERRLYMLEASTP